MSYPTTTAANTAAWLDGKDARLRVAEADMPKPGNDEIVVKNYAVAINPVDWKIQDSGMFIQQWPNILGCDIAGEVSEVGSEVQRFKKGDRVFAHTISLLSQKPQDGGFQAYSAAKANKAALIPHEITYASASVLPLALDTAAVGLYTPSPQGLGLPHPTLTPSSTPSTTNKQTIIVWGGSSSVGALAIQLAVASGVTVIATASPHNHAFCTSLGAHSVHDYRSPSIIPDLISAVQSTNGTFAGLYDAISTSSDSYPSTVPVVEGLGGGVLAVVLTQPENPPASVQAARVFGISEKTEGLWREFITPALEEGVVKCVPEAWVVGKGLESVQKGLEENKKGVSARKVVVELE